MDRSLASLDASSPSFNALRAWLFAALGLTALGCGGNVTTGSSSGGSGVGGGVAGGGGVGGASSLCLSPTPILQPDGKESGFVRCADGAIDRVAPGTCGVTLKDTCLGTEMTLECVTGMDCTAKEHGSCVAYSGGAPGPEVTGCGCQYQCATDADCDPGSICACAGVGDPEQAFCISAPGCALPGDCASGECGYSEYDNGCWTEKALHCRSSADTCRGDAECPSTAPQCAVSDINVGTFGCATSNCQIGRPLLVGDTLLFAPSERRADWTEQSVCPETASLAPGLRAALAAHFTAMGAMEHASIGSFARFSLELLALGAPPALLEATHDAAGDEILHARLAFALATAYLGAPVGPGKLPVTGVAPATDEREIVRALVREACVGETVAAAEALALSTIVTDPALVSVHTKVSKDEARHAELGWRSLAWMLERSPDLLPVVEEAFRGAMATISGAPLVGSDVVSPEHGLLSPAALAALRAKAVREIVEPCRIALIEKATSPGREERAPQAGAPSFV